MPEDTIERFQAYVGQSLEYVNDEPQWGWVSPRHLLDCNISEDTCKIAGFYHLCLRQAERKVPNSLLNAECRMVEYNRMAETGVQRISKKERKEIKEEVRKRLISEMPPTLSGMYVAIDPVEKLLFTTATSQHSMDIFLGMFNKTFGFEPIPLSPEVVAAEFYAIDPAQVPSVRISPNAKADTEDEEATLGKNFLTWLWFFQEVQGGILPANKLGEFGMMIDGPLTLVSEGSGAFESVLRKGTPTISAEAKASLMVGKKLKQAKFVLAKDANSEWSCTLDADTFTFRGLKLPEGDAMDPEAIFEERMTNLFIFHSVFFGLFEKYLKEMTNPQKLEEYKSKAREWVANRQEK